MRALVLLLATLLPSFPAAAVDAEWVLAADVPLASRAPAEQKLALQEGMRRVLVRLSGRSNLGTSVPLARAFAEPHLYAKQITAVPIVGGEALHVVFNQVALESLLKAMNLPSWPLTRPQLLVWTAAGGGSDARLGGNTGFNAVLQASARTRGLPLQLPRLDAIDREAVSGGDVAARNLDPVLRASARYQAEMVLLGSWRESGNGAGTGDWLLVSAAGSAPFRASSASAIKHAEALTEWLVGIASGRQALPGSAASGGAVRVLIQGVQSLDDYAGVFAVLGKAQEVRDVQLQSYVGDVLIVGVSARSGNVALLRGLSAAPGFAVDLAAGLGTGSAGPELRLRWTPRRAP